MQKVALITGGARGIGLGIAQALAAEGYRLALNGVRDEKAVAGTLAEFARSGVETIYCRGDVGVADDRARIVDEVRRRLGRLDVLVNNAGITSPGRKDILDADEAAFDRVMAVNLKGPYFLTQLAAQWMIAQRAADASFRGVIINVSSVSGEIVSTNRGDYCLSKAGLRMATRLWAVRLAEFGIDVYEIQPGIIRSDMSAAATEKYDRLIAEGLTLQRRWGEPADVGRVAAMLARGDMPYSTGEVLRIDGGLTIRQL